MENAKIIKLGIEIPAELHRRVKIEAATRGVKMKQATSEAFTAWLEVAADIPALTPEESVHVAALLYALRNANDDKLFQIELLLKPFLNKPAAPAAARRKSA